MQDRDCCPQHHRIELDHNQDYHTVNKATGSPLAHIRNSVQDLDRISLSMDGCFGFSKTYLESQFAVLLPALNTMYVRRA